MIGGGEWRGGGGTDHQSYMVVYYPVIYMVAVVCMIYDTKNAYYGGG